MADQTVSVKPDPKYTGSMKNELNSTSSGQPLKTLKSTYVAPIYTRKVQGARHYTSGIICSQETVIAQLQHMRYQMDKDDRELKRLQEAIDQSKYPRRWTPYNTYPNYVDDDEYRY